MQILTNKQLQSFRFDDKKDLKKLKKKYKNYIEVLIQDVENVLMTYFKSIDGRYQYCYWQVNSNKMYVPPTWLKKLMKEKYNRKGWPIILYKRKNKTKRTKEVESWHLVTHGELLKVLQMADFAGTGYSEGA